MPLIEQKHREFVNERGNTVKTFATPGIGDRYYFDFQLYTSDKGWEQYDTHQDAWYFGVWVNIEERKIATYAEGDFTLVIAPDVDHLIAELGSMADFYGPAPPAFRMIDDKGRITHVYDRRPGVDPEPF